MKSQINSLPKIYLKILLGAIVVGMILYHLTISDTLKIYHTYSSLKIKEVEMSNIHYRLKKLKAEKSDIESQFGKGSNSATLNLLRVLSDYCDKNKVLLKSIPPLVEFKDDGIIFQNQTFVVEGSFIELLKLLKILEEQQDIGVIASVKFGAEKDHLSKQRKLIATCVIQNIQINNYES